MHCWSRSIDQHLAGGQVELCTGFYSYLYLYLFVDKRSVHERVLTSHSGAVPCGSGARQCNAIHCCARLCPHGYLILGPMI